MATEDSSEPATPSYNPWGAALPESVQFIVFDFVVPGRRTYDGRGRRVLRDTMDARSETLCDDRVESSPLWDLKLQPASRAWRAARATGKAFYEDFASVAVARAAANLQMGDYVAAISGLASLAGALPPRGIRGRTSPGTVDPGPTQQLRRRSTSPSRATRRARSSSRRRRARGSPCAGATRRCACRRLELWTRPAPRYKRRRPAPLIDISASPSQRSGATPRPRRLWKKRSPIR